jgi:5-methylcytosine-specific restriction endonuclease McrA
VIEDPNRPACPHCGLLMWRHGGWTEYRCTRPECRASRGMGARTSGGGRNDWRHLTDVGVCESCARPFWPRVLKTDHIVAMSLGGVDVEENIQILCPTCHDLKSLHERGVEVPDWAWPNRGRPRGLLPFAQTGFAFSASGEAPI